MNRSKRIRHGGERGICYVMVGMEQKDGKIGARGREFKSTSKSSRKRFEREMERQRYDKPIRQKQEEELEAVFALN